MERYQPPSRFFSIQPRKICFFRPGDDRFFHIPASDLIFPSFGMFRNLLQRYPPAVKNYHFHGFPPFAILVLNRIGSDTKKGAIRGMKRDIGLDPSPYRLIPKVTPFFQQATDY
jgi:hypothetical protein